MRLYILIVTSLCSMTFGRDAEPQCGGLLMEDSGWFTPVMHVTKDKTCLWIIKNQPEKRIKVQINDMETTKEPYCSAVRIEVEDDNRLLGKYCGTGEVPPMFTTTDHMYVLAFYGSDHDFFFNATYSHIDIAKKQCGGQLLEPIGWFQSFDNDKDHMYDSSLDCIWVLQTDPDKKIVVNFLYFDLRGEENCENGDYLQIKDGYDILGRHCGSFLPPLLVSDSSIVKLKFHTDHKEEGEGFNATFRHISVDSLNCGGFLQQDSGKLEISDPNRSDENVDCVWVISTDEDKIIQLKITKFLLPNAGDCMKENLFVNDDTGLKRKFCSSTRGKLIKSTSNFLLVTLSSGNLQDVVFTASYSEIFDFSNICGGHITEGSGLITSPVLSSSKGSGPVTCFWVIEGSDRKEIEFEIKYLEIQKTAPCTDYLQVYDGHSPRIKLCEADPVKDIIRSMSNVMYVRFHLHDRTSDSTFRGKYTPMPALNKVCGGVLNDTNVPGGGRTGIIQTPDYDANGRYDDNLDCLWTIVAEEHHVIFLWFEVMLLEYDPKCKYDYIRIFEDDGEADAAPKCGALQTQSTLDTISDSNKLHIHFVSDASIHEVGFYAKFSQVEDPMAMCEKDVNRTSGWIAPFQHQFITTKDMDCHYILRMEPDYVVHLDPFQLDIIESGFCTTEFVEIEESERLCGKQSLPAFRSKTNIARVHYKTVANSEQLGFNISYRQIKAKNTHIDVTMREPEGWIAFPFGQSTESERYLSQLFDTTYGPYNLKFLWTVVCNESDVIMATIMLVTLYNHPVLTTEKKDSLAIYEPHKEHYSSFTASEDSVDDEAPAEKYISEYNELHVDFITDEWGDQWVKSQYDRVRDSGFIVKYAVLQDTHDSCGEFYACLQGNNTIKRDQLCNNYADCFGEDDERYCYICPKNCTCSRLAIDCTQKTTCEYTDGDILPMDSARQNLERYEGIRSLDTSGNPVALQNLKLEKLTMRFLRYLNISFCEITEFPIAFFRFMESLEVLDISFNALKRLPAQTFLKQNRLRHLYFKGNTELITFEPMSFTGLTSLKEIRLSQMKIDVISANTFSQLTLHTLQISLSTINYFPADAFRDLQVANLILNTTKIRDFSNRFFEGVQNVSLLVTDSYMICCIKPFYLPKDRCFPSKPTVQSCHDLLGNERYLLWISGLVALLVNLGSMKGRLSSYDEKAYPGHSYFLFSLAFSNFLSATYIMVIIGGDTVLRGNYFTGRITWLSGKWCKFSNAISAISIFSTVTSLLLIAVGRYLVAKYPTGDVSFSKRKAVSAVMVSLIISVVVSSTPLMYEVISGKEVYTDYGLCFGLSFTYDSSIAWRMFLMIPLFVNFCTLVIVILSLAHAYSETREIKVKMIRGRLNRTKDLAVSRNILFLVILNVIYTSSIYVLAWLGKNNDFLGHEFVAWTTVLMVSMASALSPLLFNLSMFFDYTTFEPSESEQKRPKLCTKAEFDQLLSLMQSRCFLKPGTRKRGYTCLPRLLRTRRLGQREITFIACSLARRITGFHAKTLVLGKLIARDVYVKNRLKRRGYAVVMICRTPLLVNSPTDAARDIEDYGTIVTALVNHYDNNRITTETNAGMSTQP